MSEEKLLQKITGFINDIGIPCDKGIVDQYTFVPGIDIVEGHIVYDTVMLLTPGDLLHEAGHIAVLEENERMVVTSPDVTGDLGNAQAEMAAIAWSWAAAEYLDIAPEVIFHEDGYRGGSEVIMNKFHNGNYFGVDTLESFGMTAEQTGGNEKFFPEMEHWLRP
ncbi:MAG: hypothetical protein KDC07_01160 [Chitinophagaceae bacterium]|nr:hypothetical protein [Chitinophagaceae bacterium]MCB9044668.1 hypothetical protein [Chitinophagales bacterium]